MCIFDLFTLRLCTFDFLSESRIFRQALTENTYSRARVLLSTPRTLLAHTPRTRAVSEVTRGTIPSPETAVRGVLTSTPRTRARGNMYFRPDGEVPNRSRCVPGIFRPAGSFGGRQNLRSNFSKKWQSFSDGNLTSVSRTKRKVTEES